MLKSTYVIIPSLNPDEHLIETINGLKEVGFCHFLLVDDGSDTEHRKNFPKITKDTMVLHHKTNYGKGAALKTAFRYISKHYPDAKYMVTVDGDGQHAPKDAKKCVEALGDKKYTTVLGARCFSEENVPLRSKLGNNITLFVFHKLCGINISDTQTGLRAFPVELIPLLLQIDGKRFEYETNMLLKFKQRGVEIDEVPIETVYIEENHASHFRTVQDSFLVYKFILAYLLSSGISFLVDIVLFTIFLKVFGGLDTTPATFLATGIARLFSSLINYSINKRKVFDYSEDEAGKNNHTLLKYYALCIPQMCVSAFFVSLFVKLIPALLPVETLIKIIVDLIIFLVNYRVQRSWVFSEKSATINDANAEDEANAEENSEETETTEETKEETENVEDSSDDKDEIKSEKKSKAELSDEAPKHAKYKKPNYVGRVFLCIGTFLLMVIITVSAACLMIVYGPSTSVRNMCVLSAKQASATKWIPSLFMSQKSIDEIMKASATVNTDVISVEEITADDEWDDAIDGMKLKFIQKPRFKAYVLIIQDPSRVSLGVSSENFATATSGMRFYEIAEKYKCTAAINGGEFSDPGGSGTGAAPIGLTYSGGKCVWRSSTGGTFIGIDKNNQLVVKEGLTQSEADALGVRDGCCFQYGNVLIEKDGDNVKLNYANDNVGTAQRTAIGQRADGAIVFVVTDGRSGESIGATRNDVIDLLVEYGAVSAGLLDGGSSSLLYYRDYFDKYDIDKNSLDEYQQMGLVNRYKAFTTPRRIPTYFIVAGE